MPWRLRAEPRAEVKIRWMIRHDMRDVLAIERASQTHPWVEEEILHLLRRPNNIAKVAERGERIVGFIVYDLHILRLDLLNIAVHPEHRRQGVGRQMVEMLADKLTSHGRRYLTCRLDESDLDRQLFLRACGFRAFAIDQCDGREDVYCFARALTSADMPTTVVHEEDP